MTNQSSEAISLFASPIDSPRPPLIGKFHISQILNGIMCGTWDQTVQATRAIPEKKLRQKYKIANVPFFYPSAILRGALREDGDAIQHTGLIAIDIDGSDPTATKQLIGADPYLHACFVSVSGNGVCALFVVDPPEQYGQDAARSLGKYNIQAWQAITEYLRDRYNLVADASGKNIARARYVSTDPEIYGYGENALPFPVKLQANEVMVAAGKYDNAERPDLLIDLLRGYLSAEIARSYFTRDNLSKAGYDVSGYAHQSVIRVAWFCGGFDHIIGAAGRQFLVEHFLSEMEGRPNFDRPTDARKFLDQYDRGTARPLSMADLPGASRVEWKKPVEGAALDPFDEQSFRVQCRAAIYANKMSDHWVAQYAATAAMSLEFCVKAASEEREKYGEPIRQARRKVQALQFVNMANLAGVKFAEGIGQPVHVPTDQHRAISKEAIRSIVEENLGVRFGRDAVTEGHARIHEGDRFDPIRAWLHDMPEHDGADHIAALAGHFKSSDPHKFERYLKLWLAATAKCALEEQYTNRFALVLTSGRQSIGKSYFFASYLVPPHIYAEGLELGGRDGDIGRALASALIVNLEEFTAPKEVHRLKKIISQPSFTGRAAFGRAPELFIRRASFAVCTNDPMFLTDVSNTRFLCAVLEDIDRHYSVAIRRENVWAQAIALSRGDQANYTLTRHELEELDNWNRSFVVVDNAEQFIAKYFALANPGDMLARQMSSAELQSYIEQRTGIRSHERAYREALRRMKWPHNQDMQFDVLELKPGNDETIAPTFPHLPQIPDRFPDVAQNDDIPF